MSYLPYADYVERPVEWLDLMPSHWSVVPIKYLSTSENTLFIDGDWIESKDLSTSGIRYITTGNIGEGVYKEQGSGYISEETFVKLNCTEVFPGDLLISRLNNPIGRACIIPELGSRIVTSVDNVIVRPDTDFSVRYLKHLLTSSEYFEHTGNLARGTTMQRISRGLLGNIRIVIPPLDEQAQISTFLDRETAKIDLLIKKQLRLIELLKEKRQAVISHAVTKGLNPDAPMKDSGVKWLGEVPAHWEVKQLKRLIKSLESGVSVNATDIPATTSEYGVLKTSCVYTRFFRPEENKTVFEEEVERLKCPVRAGAIIISRMNTPDLVGASAYVELNHENLFLPDRLWQTVFDNSVMVNAEYLSYFMMIKSFRVQISIYAAGTSSSMQNIAQEDYLSIPVCLPTPDEQKRIVDLIKEQLEKLDRLRSKANKAVELLKERRTALISAAVTGKIDVRDQVPQDVEEAVAS